MRLRSVAVCLGVLVLCGAGVQADAIPVANHSFEVVEIDPVLNPYGAIPLISMWTELDVDANSQSTGVFRNTSPDSSDHIINADGSQLAFLGSFQGNSISQYTASKYQAGKRYQLTVAVCVSDSAPPVGQNPLMLEFLYWGVFEPITIASVPVLPTGLTSTSLQDFTLDLPTVEPMDPWSGQNIGIAIRATGVEGGFWDLDNVRLMEYPRTPNFTDDSVVNLADFAKMAAEWLSCTGTTTDVTGEGCVDQADLMILAEQWLANV